MPVRKSEIRLRLVLNLSEHARKSVEKPIEGTVVRSLFLSDHFQAGGIFILHSE